MVASPHSTQRQVILANAVGELCPYYGHTIDATAPRLKVHANRALCG